MDHAGLKQALQGRTLPAAYVDLAAFDANVQQTLARAGQLPIRIATKSLRCVPLIKRVLAAAREAGVQLEGVMGYEAQIAGVPDEAPGDPTNPVVRFLKARSRKELSERRQAIVKALRDAGAPLRFVNGGGTGSIERTAAEPAVTEVTAGSGFYAPTLFDHYRAFKGRPAAGFALAVTRLPGPGLYTCFGGGYVASGAAGPAKLPTPYLPAGARLLPHEGAGEVQTPIAYHGQLALGDPVGFRHAKAGELCERFDSLLLLVDGRVQDEVRTYRGEGRTFG
jgi:D-serine deaminase-like pyridoxal phosphate-dependent protein